MLSVLRLPKEIEANAIRFVKLDRSSVDTNLFCTSLIVGDGKYNKK